MAGFGSREIDHDINFISTQICRIISLMCLCQRQLIGICQTRIGFGVLLMGRIRITMKGNMRGGIVSCEL